MITEDMVQPGEGSRWLMGVLAILGLALLAIWWPGCRQYPELSSRDGIILNQALYTVCARKDPQQLDPFARRVDQAVAEGKLTHEQADAFHQILGLARSGDWAAAKSASYRFAEDQVR